MLNVSPEVASKESEASKVSPATTPAESARKDKETDIKPAEVPGIGAFGAMILLATLLTILGTGMLYLMSLSKEENAQAKQIEFASISQELTTGELAKLDKDLQEISSGASALASALDSRIYWSKFWAEINRLTPKTVSYQTMTVDKEGSVAISGVAGDFTAVAKLMVSLQQADLFSEVQLGGTSLKEGEAGRMSAFSIRLKVKPELLVKNAQGN